MYFPGFSEHCPKKCYPTFYLWWGEKWPPTTISFLISMVCTYVFLNFCRPRSKAMMNFLYPSWGWVSLVVGCQYHDYISSLGYIDLGLPWNVILRLVECMKTLFNQTMKANKWFHESPIRANCLLMCLKQSTFFPPLSRRIVSVHNHHGKKCLQLVTSHLIKRGICFISCFFYFML